MLGRTTPSSGQAQKRPLKLERESTAAPASEQEAKDAPDLRSALARWEDEGGSWLPLTEPVISVRRIGASGVELARFGVGFENGDD